MSSDKTPLFTQGLPSTENGRDVTNFGSSEPNRAVSTAGVRSLHTGKVTGSIPVLPTISSRGDATYLYRHFDETGRLLYVGISLSFIARLTQHKDASHWAHAIRSVKAEVYPTRKEATEAETNAIQVEAPLYNIAKASCRKARDSSGEPPKDARQKPKRRTGRTENRLTERSVAAAKAGLHCDGGGLYLAVLASGGKSWLWRFRQRGGRRDMGLGSAIVIRLPEARALRDKWRSVLASGLDPIKERDRRRKFAAGGNVVAIHAQA